MKKKILDPVDFYHTNYGEAFEETDAADDLLQSSGDPLSYLHPLDEDNSFVKLGDFWPSNNRAA